MLPILIPAIIAAVGAVAQGASSIAAGNAAQKAQDQLQARRDAAERRYQQEYNTDFLDTATAKSTLAMLRRRNDKQIEAIGNDAIKQGATPETKVALAGKLNEGYAEAASRLAGFGTQYKQQLTDRHLARLDAFDNGLAQAEQGKAAAWQSLGDGIGNLSGAALSAYGAGAFGGTGAAKGAVINPMAQITTPSLRSIIAPSPAPITQITYPQYR